MALTTQKLGVTIGSLASKMSLIIPVIAALLFQGFMDNTKISRYCYRTIIGLSDCQKDENKNGPIYLAILLFIVQDY